MGRSHFKTSTVIYNFSPPELSNISKDNKVVFPHARMFDVCDVLILTGPQSIH